MRTPFHTATWLLWLLAALLPTLLSKNPWYMLLLLAIAGADYYLLGRGSPVAQSWGLFLRLGLFLVVFSVAFNLLFSTYGATELFQLPRWRLATGRAIIFQLGGPLTLEGLAYGLANGLSLMVILMTLATFNTLVDHYLLLRSIPRFLYQTAVIISIAITFVPLMVVAQREIREAQALRGHRFRGLRDLPPLFIALLVEGLERAIGLAESMEARGFGGRVSASAVRRELLFRAAIAFSLFILLAGAFALAYFPLKWPGGLLAALGAGILLLSLWLIGRSVERSRYRRELWRRRDTVVSLACGLSLGLIALLRLADRAALSFYPYPRLSLPPFNPLVGLALLALLAPVAVALWEKKHDRTA
jgi:energy-coupling factor transport system permease protein